MFNPVIQIIRYNCNVHEQSEDPVHTFKLDFLMTITIDNSLHNLRQNGPDTLDPISLWSS